MAKPRACRASTPEMAPQSGAQRRGRIVLRNRRSQVRILSGAFVGKPLGKRLSAFSGRSGKGRKRRWGQRLGQCEVRQTLVQALGMGFRSPYVRPQMEMLQVSATAPGDWSHARRRGPWPGPPAITILSYFCFLKNCWYGAQQCGATFSRHPTSIFRVRGRTKPLRVGTVVDRHASAWQKA